MQTIIRKWGNSLAIRLPQHVVAELAISEGSALDIEVDDGVLVAKPSRPRYRLEDLLAGYGEADRHTETVWGDAVGKEKW